MTWWEGAYRLGHVNWDPGDYDRHLPWLLREFDIRPCRAVDLGCGSGKSAVWLARRGFDVVGIDLAPTAIREARALAQRHRARVVFLEGRFPDDFPAQAADNVLQSGGFGLAIERGFLQHLDPGRELASTLARIAELLQPESLFYSLITAREGNRGGWGHMLWTEAQIRAAIKPLFRIRHMERSVFTPGERGSMAAWVTVMSPR